MNINYPHDFNGAEDLNDLNVQNDLNDLKD